MFVAICVGHDIRTLQTQVQWAQRDNGLTVGGVLVRLRNDARLLVYVLQYCPIVLERLLARILNHDAHVLYNLSAGATKKLLGNAPQPYAMCAIWLLGTTAPLAFFTSFGLASAGGFAMVSMVG